MSKNGAWKARAQAGAFHSQVRQFVRERKQTSPSSSFRDWLRGLAGTVAAPVRLWGCTHVGERVHTFGRPRVVNGGRIEIRDDVVIDSRFTPVELVTTSDGKIVVGVGS